MTFRIDTLPATVHGTSVSIEGRGVLLHGPSGAGKSSIALQLMAYGARLISDDLVEVRRSGIDDAICLARPKSVRTPLQIEARNFGLLTVTQSAKSAPLCVIIDLTQTESARLPPTRFAQIAGCPVPICHNVANPAFPAMVTQYVRNMADPET